VKLIPDESQRAMEKEILEGLGFIVLRLHLRSSLRRRTRPIFSQNISG
jgi:hypothetical protein